MQKKISKKRTFFIQLLNSILCMLLAAPNGWAEPRGTPSEIPSSMRAMLKSTTDTPLSAAEYTFQSKAGEPLIPVRILGSVNRPGIYYIPPDTDLTTTLSLAGGSSPSANLSELTINRGNMDAYPRRIKLNFEQTLTKGDSDVPRLAANDVVYVPEKKPLLGADTPTVVAVLAALTSITLSIVLISRNTK